MKKWFCFLRYLPLFVISALLILSGCRTQRETTNIVDRTGLPVYKGEIGEEPMNLRVLFEIREDGSVSDVRFLNGLADEDWNLAAIDSMKRWKFDPPETDSGSVWVHQNVKVAFQTVSVMNLGELVTRSEEDARVLYSRLRAGIGFEQLVRQFSNNMDSGISVRYIEEASILDFPDHVGNALENLEAGDFTRPISVDGSYVIYKRFGERLPGSD